MPRNNRRRKNNNNNRKKVKHENNVDGGSGSGKCAVTVGSVPGNSTASTALPDVDVVSTNDASNIVKSIVTTDTGNRAIVTSEAECIERRHAIDENETLLEKLNIRSDVECNSNNVTETPNEIVLIVPDEHRNVADVEDICSTASLQAQPLLSSLSGTSTFENVENAVSLNTNSYTVSEDILIENNQLECATHMSNENSSRTNADECDNNSLHSCSFVVVVNGMDASQVYSTNSRQQPAATANITSTPAAVITQYITYDAGDDSGHCGIENPLENAQQLDDEKIQHLTDDDHEHLDKNCDDNTNDVNVDINSTEISALLLSDTESEGIDIRADNPNRTYQRYRVESPKLIGLPTAPKIGAIKKSRSLDDNEMLIQELSDTGSTSAENDNTPIISEAESEVEPDASDSETFSMDKALRKGTLVDLTSSEEQLINELINSSDNLESDDLKQKRARKKAAIETHFLPQFLNPKYLDVIKEEGSDASDVELRKISDSTPSTSKTVYQQFDDLDDDVFIDNSEISKRANAVFPKSNFDFSTRRKHVSRLHGMPDTEVIREEPPCLLVDAKLLEPAAADEMCSKWTTATIGERECSAEIVFLGGSSSSSASDVNDIDSVGDADIEDFHEDGLVRMETPVIGGDFRNCIPIDSSSARITQNVDSPDCDLSTVPNTNSDIPSNNIQSQLDASASGLSVPNFIIGDPCANTVCSLFSHNNKLNVVGPSNNDFTRQDSTGSLCSSQSHSTSQSQSTARFCTTSPPRDLADFEPSSCISGPPSLNFSQHSATLKTLRELCLDALTSMPYGSLILEELAQVAGSLGELASKHHTQLLLQATSMPYPTPDIPYIRELEVAHKTNTNQEATSVKLVAKPPTAVRSPSPPPVPERPKMDAWLGMPTESDPNLLVCFSPSQRNYMNEKKPTNYPNPDHLLEMHKNFIERRGYHEYSDVQLKAMMNNAKATQNEHENDDEHDGDCTTKDKNRLLAIIRDSRQLPSEIATNRNVESVNTKTSSEVPSSSSRTTTSDQNITKGAKMSSFSQFDANFDEFTKRFSNLDPLFQMNNSIKRYSNIEKTTYDSRKRIENGKVVYEHSDTSTEKSSNMDGDGKLDDCIDHSSAFKNIKSDSKLDQQNVAGSSTATTTTTMQNERRNYENPLAEQSTKNSYGERTRTESNSTLAAEKTATTATQNQESEYFNDDHYKFSAFDRVPPSTQSNINRSTAIIDHQLYSHVENSLHQNTNKDETDIITDNIIKPIVREENLCKGFMSSVQVRAPRISPLPGNMSTISERLEETKRQYDMQSNAQKYQNRQSMIDQTPITYHMPPGHNPLRRKSLPKELHDRQLEYIRQKEQELNYEFDKLEHDRRNLLREIEQMQVNQSFQDFVTAHKNESRRSSAQTSSNYVSEAELFRQQMHDEWLNKVAEREERRLHKIIKITRPTDENCPQQADGSIPSISAGQRPPDLGNEFLNRVKERRTKLKMPSDSDWESGAESQPEPRQQEERKVDPTIKVLEGESETDICKLPDHIKEFASDFTKSVHVTETMTSSSSHTNRHEHEVISTTDGESSLTFFGLVVAVAFVCWTIFRSIITNTNYQRN